MVMEINLFVFFVEYEIAILSNFTPLYSLTILLFLVKLYIMFFLEAIMDFKGRCWKYGDNIDTDKIIPARYLNTSEPSELAKHCLEDEDTTFAGKVKDGDMLVVGYNFGSGSSREHAPIALKACGVSVIIAKTFARIFFRNCINIAIPVVENTQAVDDAQNGDIFHVDFDNGVLQNLTQEKEYKIHPLPDMMKNILSEGGLMNHAKSILNL